MKFALRSRTVWSSLTVIGSMLALLLGDMGVLSLTDQLTQLFQGLAAGGGAMSIYGRVKATGPLTLKPGKDESDA